MPPKSDLRATPVQQWAEVAVENLPALSRAIIKGKKTEQASDQACVGTSDSSVLCVGETADRCSMLAGRTIVHELVRTIYAVIVEGVIFTF